MLDLKNRKEVLKFYRLLSDEDKVLFNKNEEVFILSQDEKKTKNLKSMIKAKNTRIENLETSLRKKGVEVIKLRRRK